MSNSIKELEPKLLWKYFAELSEIPRQSKHEEVVSKWLYNLGKEKGFETKRDKVGNVLIKIPATKGYENAPTVVLQGHMDMVCEKNNDTEHDFAKDPIKLKIEGEWVTAEGTTLGADNGIGVAAALAFMDDTEAIHGPIEILSTIDEETGMTGAFELSSDFVSGRYMLNLDSEEDGALYVGCAGGADVKLFYDLKKETSDKNEFLKVEVKGLRGGHSGLNIIENRANALRLLGRLLYTLRSENIDFNIASMDGGSAHNAIPREAEAVIAVKSEDSAKVQKLLQTRIEIAKAEYGKREPEMELIITQVSGSEHWSDQLTEDLVDVILTVPNGVLTMSQDLPDLVESSCNLATIKENDGKLTVHLSTRSSVGPVVSEIQNTIAIIGKRCNAEVELGEGYPAWQPDMDSPLLATAIKVFKEKFDKEPAIKAIHAGLECGVIGEKFHGMKMLSFGPEIHGAHSPDEKVHIPSVQRFWDYLKYLLENIAKN